MSGDGRVRRALALKADHDAGALDADGQRELAELLRSEPACRQEIGADVVLDRLLRLQAGAPSADQVALGVRKRREAEASASRFMRSVRPRTRIATRRPAHRPRLVPRFVAAGAAAAAALIAVVLLARGARPAEAPPNLRVVAASAAASAGSPLVPGMALVAGQSLSTGPGGSLSLAFADGSSVVLGEQAGLAVRDLLPAKRLTLSRGSLAADIRGQPPGHPLAIATPHGEATVLGTRFTLSAQASTVLEVASGRVRLTDLAGRRQEVDAGGRAEAGAAPPAPTPTQPQGPDATALWQEAAVRYDFRDGSGAVVRDRSPTALDLRILDARAVAWLPGGGLRILRPTRLRSISPASGLTLACRASGAFSVLLDIEPAPLPADDDVRDQPKRIICLPRDLLERSFSLGQGLFRGANDVFDMRVHTSQATSRGRPSVATAEGTVAPRRMRVAFTRDATGRSAFHLDGRRVPVRTVDAQDRLSAAMETALVPGTLEPWDPALHLTLAAEPDADEFGTRAWLGTFHGVAIFARALDDGEVGALSADP